MVITTSGSIASFRTPVKQPLKSLKVYFSPIQNGSGDPSPSNVRPITGWTGLEVTRCGKNLFNLWGNGYWYTSSKRWESDSAGAVCKPIHMNSGMTVTISQTNESATYQFHEWNKCVSTPSAYTNADNLSFIRSSDGQGKTYTVQTDKFLTAFANIGSDTMALRKVQLELGSTASSYEPYSGTTIPVDWTSEAGTLYGGYVDLISGELVQTHYGMQINRNTITSMKMDKTNETYTQAYFINSNNSIPKFKAYTGLSNRFKGLNTTVAEVNGFINFGGNVYFMIPSADLATKDVAGILDWFDANPTFLVAELSTPVTYQLQPVQLETFIGRNNIFSNADTVEAVYDHVDTMDMIRIRQKVLKGCQRYKTVLPPGYEEYDYLQRTGHYSLIDTGVDGTDTTLQFDFVYMPLTNASYGALFGNYTDENTKCWRIIHIASSHADYNKLFYVTARNNRAGASPAIRPVQNDSFIGEKIRFEIEMGLVKTTVGDYSVSWTISGTGSEAPSTKTIAISSNNPTGVGGYGMTGRFYGHFRIWSQNALIREYVPAVRLSDNKAGFYDLVNYTFNPSIGTEEFVAGND